MVQVAVVGSGQMGSGIAQVLATNTDKEVFLYDISAAAVSQARDSITASLRKLTDKGKLPKERVDRAMGQLQFVTDLPALQRSVFFIEAIVENAAAKTELFQELDRIAEPQAIFASNTSSIPISTLAKATKRPEKVIGMHFMNPVPLMSLVEVIRSPQTSDDTYNTTCTLAKEMGKETVCSKDVAGFIVNRILMPMINEAFFVLHDGIATAADIDQAMKLGTNQPMGPLALADLVGLDTCLFILEVLYRDLKDPKFRPCPLLQQLVNDGFYGRKSGRGVFHYER